MLLWRLAIATRVGERVCRESTITPVQTQALWHPCSEVQATDTHCLAAAPPTLALAVLRYCVTDSDPVNPRVGA